ncbi:MAG: hypothetical protein PHE89_06435 [Alphaproteobacteria bacterium]|nr:hypothetical protein [Alphaproteobacteria bacterium]
MVKKIDTKYYQDVNEYRDGMILIYKREGSPNYQCRLKIDEGKGKAYEVKSCKTRNLGIAQKLAEDWFDDYRYKVKNKLPLKTKTFKEIYKDWINQAEKSQNRQKFYEGRANLYLLEYFGNYKIDEINEDIVRGYWQWRKDYYKNNPNKIKGNVAVEPSPTSLKMERTAIEEVFKYAQRKRYISIIPFDGYKIRGETECRDEFKLDELTKLKQEFFLSTLDSNQKKSIEYQKKMLYNLVVFLVNTGIRPTNEVYGIKWKHIKVSKDNEGRYILQIDIMPNNKTGARIVISNPEAYDVYNNIKGFSKYKDADDYFFNNYNNGSPVKNISKTFIEKLKELNLYISENGKKRPLYSLRHTYATQRLLAGVEVYNLAKNMGTSVKEIEKHYGHTTNPQLTDKLVKNTEISSIQEYMKSDRYKKKQKEREREREINKQKAIEKEIEEVRLLLEKDEEAFSLFTEEIKNAKNMDESNKIYEKYFSKKAKPFSKSKMITFFNHFNK